MQSTRNIHRNNPQIVVTRAFSCVRNLGWGQAMAFVVIALIVTMSFFANSTPAGATSTTLPLLGGDTAQGQRPFDVVTGFSLHIPRISVNVDVAEAWVRGQTWDFSAITSQAAHLELTAFPGEGSNVAIGAHYELANFVPGPFYHLDQLEIGDQIVVAFQGQERVYQVAETMMVDPSQIAVVYPTSFEALTLLTCYDYSPASGNYSQRYVVRALPVTSH